MFSRFSSLCDRLPAGWETTALRAEKCAFSFLVRSRSGWETPDDCCVQLEVKRCRPEAWDWDRGRDSDNAHSENSLFGRRAHARKETIEFADNGGRSHDR